MIAPAGGGFGDIRMRGLMPVAPLMAALALGACASDDIGPSAAELRARWEAQNVFPQGYKSDLTAFLRTYLNDPTNVRGAAVSVPQLKSAGPGQRYVACVRYNARNTDGKYIGSKDGAAVYVSGKLDQFVDTPRETRELCKDVSYAPFPELEKLTR
jgi:hypothetical protein